MKTYDKDCRHARKVWNKFNIKHLGEHQASRRVPIILRCRKSNRKNKHKKHDFISLGFATLPSLSRASFPKKAKIDLEVTTDIDMLHIHENGIRGGVIRAVHHYAEANNK